MYKIGVDVGGTNTDAVIIDQHANLVNSIKTPTTPDIQSGIRKAIHEVIDNTEINTEDIDYAMLGTTQCTNAIVERKNLSKVGVIRVGYPATESVLPHTGWPEELKEATGNKFALVHGGYEYDGRLISEMDKEEITSILKEWEGEIESLAIIGVFSSVNDDQERMISEYAKEIYGEDFPVSRSSMIGSIGFLDRENSTILNAALHKVIVATTDGFKQAQRDEGIMDTAIYLCQNDGTLMSVDYAREYPILTVACGPTNSIRGASYLAKRENAITLDVGGTTSDIGVLVDGFPRESSISVQVGGVRTNFRMPDIASIGLGGGSIVRENNGNITVGPDSVGHNIITEAKVFGGDQITATDIAVRLGKANIGNPQLVKDIPLDFAQKAEQEIKKMVEIAIDSMKTDPEDVEVILVGGGSIVVPTELAGVSNVIKSENGSVANAIGASISQIGGEFEQLYSYDEKPREDSIEDAKERATNQALKAGAIEETIELVEIEEVPIAYSDGNMNKVSVKVVGDMK